MADGVKIYPWCENTAANLAHDAPEMILAAEQLKGFVLAMAAIHNKTGNYIGKIVIRGGRKDSGGDAHRTRAQAVREPGARQGGPDGGAPHGDP